MLLDGADPHFKNAYHKNAFDFAKDDTHRVSADNSVARAVIKDRSAIRQLLTDWVRTPQYVHRRKDRKQKISILSSS